MTTSLQTGQEYLPSLDHELHLSWAMPEVTSRNDSEMNKFAQNDVPDTSVMFQAKFIDEIPSEMNSKIHLVDLAGRWVLNRSDVDTKHRYASYGIHFVCNDKIGNEHSQFNLLHSLGQF